MGAGALSAAARQHPIRMPDSPPRQRRVSSHSVHRRRRLIALVVAIAVLAVGVDAVRGDSTSGWGGSLNTGSGIRAAIEVPWIQRPRDAFGREVDVNGLPVAASQQEVLAKLIKTGKPVFCAGGTKPYISLTFDDGPSKEGERIVSLLRADRQRASFFLIGNSVTEFPQEVPLRLQAGDVGDHSTSHPDLTTLGPADRAAEIGNARNKIQNASGTAVTTFRPPYGARDDSVDAAIAKQGLLSVMWNVDSEDWQGLDQATLEQKVFPNLKPGAIILFHETKDNTAQFLPALLKEMKKRGLRSVTVPELLALDPPSDQKLAEGDTACEASINGEGGNVPAG